MALTEKIQLLGAGLYKDIPDELTLKSLPTFSELEYVGSEDFEEAMLDKILPTAVAENINFRDLLEIDYYWLCRCVRLMNFGPYHTTNAIFCTNCNKPSYGEYIVDLRSIECKPLPSDFKREITITKDEFINYPYDIKFQLPTIGKLVVAWKDKSFQTANGEINKELARICYTITSVNNDSELTPIEIRYKLQADMSIADYNLLKSAIESLSDYGLRSGGTTTCPRCGSDEAKFIAFIDDRFFRASSRALKQWRDSEHRK